MGRFRHVIVALVVFGLVVPMGDADAQVRDTESECTGQAKYVIKGVDGSDSDAAIYELTATWCLERVFETTTVQDDPSSQNGSSDGTVTATATSQSATLSAADADDAKQLKRRGKKAKRGRRARRRGRGGSESTTSSRTRSERRLVSTCITNFQLATTSVGEADLLDATQAPVTDSESCSGRTYRFEGRFGHDYIEDIPGFTRNVITQTVSGTRIENYPLGRVGYFDVTVRFNRDGGASCVGSGCLPFKFCDLRIVTGNTVSCIRL